MTETAEVRRDFIVRTAQAFVGIGSVMALWPFIAQMRPHRGTPPPEVRDVDLSSIQPSQTITVQWRGAPILIRHRTLEEVRLARSARVAELPDRFARNEALPKNAAADDGNRTKAGHEKWLVVVGLCTHMGCLLKSQGAAAVLVAGEGWFCPCHAARFDLSGRVVGGPARTNLPIPAYTFLSPTRIRIG
jgi:ubiquinol-cytochrome c reductase iron-sulfur subunit